MNNPIVWIAVLGFVLIGGLLSVAVVESGREATICEQHGMSYYGVRGGWFCVDRDGHIFKFRS